MGDYMATAFKWRSEDTLGESLVITYLLMDLKRSNSGCHRSPPPLAFFDVGRDGAWGFRDVGQASTTGLHPQPFLKSLLSL